MRRQRRSECGRAGASHTESTTSGRNSTASYWQPAADNRCRPRRDGGAAVDGTASVDGGTAAGAGESNDQRLHRECSRASGRRGGISISVGTEILALEREDERRCVQR